MTIEKVKQVAKEKYGKDLTDDMAAKYIEKYGKNGKLADDELDNVSGGYICVDSEYWDGVFCEPCQVWCDEHAAGGHAWTCPVCGAKYS